MSLETSLSAVLNMPDNFELIRRTVRHLAAQTVRSRIELIIVTTEDRQAQIPPSALSDFAASRVVALPTLPVSAVGYAAGVRHATSPVVALCEDHSFPEPEWAEALIRAHQQDCVAVGPGMANGNPDSVVSWANYLLTFVEWFQPLQSGPVSSCAGHNTSYKRDVLLPYDLDHWFVSERMLHADFVAKGLSIYVENQAITHHVNLSKPASFLTHSFLGGRIFGGARAAGWNLARRFLYALAFPLVPIVRLRRIWLVLGTSTRRQAARFWPALPWTLAGLCLHALGEATGYLFGDGDAMQRYTNFELYRHQHVTASDQALLRDNGHPPTAALSAT